MAEASVSRPIAAEGVDLADDLPLAISSDRRACSSSGRRAVAIDRQQRLRRPIRAEAKPASMPAWPAPTTITSKV